MNLRQYHQETVIPTVMKEFGVTNIMAMPRLLKLVINIGLKDAAHDKGLIEKVSSQLVDIAGQKPKVTRAKKSIANFKLRENDPIGLTVTLRGQRMYDFMTKLFNIGLPRVRDFQGVSLTSFDQKGNYTLGLPEQIIFPEIEYSKIDKTRGLEVTFVQTGTDATMTKRILQLLGMPFAKESNG